MGCEIPTQAVAAVLLQPFQVAGSGPGGFNLLVLTEGLIVCSSNVEVDTFAFTKELFPCFFLQFPVLKAETQKSVSAGYRIACCGKQAVDTDIARGADHNFLDDHPPIPTDIEDALG